MPPELVQRMEYHGPPCDIWATGVLFFTLLEGNFPFRGSDNKDLYKKIVNGINVFPPNFSAESVKFLRKMLVVSPRGRFSAS
jgi:MAP/microtubule affinity-regulating kinase